jgi:HEPN domain-containing protein
MREPSADWLRSASFDLKLLEEPERFDGITPLIAFHAQQVVEKCLKAVLEEMGSQIPRTHDLLRLSGLADPGAQLIPAGDSDRLRILNAVYVDVRYPGELGYLPNGEPGLTLVVELAAFAREVYSRSEDLLRNDHGEDR